MSIKALLFNSKYRLYRPGAFELFEKLHESEYWTPDQWRDYQSLRQKELVRRAFRETPFYARYYGAVGFQTGDVEQAGFFEQLPVLTKAHLRESFGDLITPSFSRERGVSTTGGSTGIPVKCAYDKTLPVEAYGWRTLGWWGVHPWDDGGYIWRNPRARRLDQAVNQTLWWPTRKIRLDASSMTPDSMQTFVSRWNRFKPPQLQGYVGAVDEFARYIESNRIPIHSPKAVWVTSAPLVPAQRSLIERVFGAPVYDQYGCCEVSWIAAQCEQKAGLHVNAERVHMEFVDEVNRSVEKGVWGRTLLTRYDDYSFPLIRYEVGDTGRFLPAACACGRTLPVIDQVKGRLTDVVRLPSGRVLTGEYLTTIFDAYPDAVNAFRVTQKKDGDLVVEFVPAHATRYDPVFVSVARDLTGKVAGEVSVVFQRVQAIPHDRGKLRFVVREA